MLKTECSLRCQSVRAYEAAVEVELASASKSIVLVGSTKRTDRQYKWLGPYDIVDGPMVNGRHVYAKRDDAEARARSCRQAIRLWWTNLPALARSPACLGPR